jgi:hypothetical protein
MWPCGSRLDGGTCVKTTIQPEGRKIKCAKDSVPYLAASGCHYGHAERAGGGGAAGDGAGNLAAGRVDAQAGGQAEGGVDDAAGAAGADRQRADRGPFGGGLVTDAGDGDRAADVPGRLCPLSLLC